MSESQEAGRPGDAVNLSTYRPRLNRWGVTPWVFFPALVIVGGASLLTMLFPDQAGAALDVIQENVVGGFGWYYVLIVAGFVVFAIWMGASRFGDIKLGKDDDQPEFSLMAWFAMLFAAGMGIGLVFWGAAEPLMHYDTPRPGVTDPNAIGDDGHGMEGIGAAGGRLAQTAMAQTYLHWGFHAWGIYVVVGLALAYAIHRKGRPVSIRWALEPLLGAERVRGWLGDLIDTVAVIGTLFGVATSLGLGVDQVAAGLESLGVIDDADTGTAVMLIVVITAVATVSVVTGLGRGIKWLSNTNLVLAALFLVAMLAIGPSLFLLRDLVQSTGGYVQNLVPMTFETGTYTGEAGQAWQGWWTTFYWGWWMSWAPFVGIFIARISRGRTIREFVAGVLIVPTAVTFLWFAVLGGSALHRQLYGEGGLVDRAADDPFERVVPENALFGLLDGLPWGGLLTVVAVVMVIVFFVTSSDSGSLVVDMLASGGNPDPPTWSRVMFAVLEGAIAAGLLLAGGLGALRTGAILTALPFSVVMILICVATYRSLKAERRVTDAVERRRRRDDLRRSVSRDITGEFAGNFEERLGTQVDERIEQALGGRDGRGRNE
ncbi:BCCT family transporter [Phytoactinopolyspora alkaliphila]|uniref:BCCT family transporter n=1 Tax=Phytoactinopolyspora alkaliphila TaxID=1783498 RepID=A0A6N9YSX9_9ACTN|nr:BCCT family transporter [Phytoactinopolyspora alkaliphila]NED98065.1 BCCT family transporter [Phytoactinopolyspora alkaliphila]